MAVASARGRQRLLVQDFSGGVNTAVAPSLIAANQVPEALNMTLRGRELVQRFGTTSVGSITGTDGTVNKYVFYTPVFSNRLFTQEGTSLVRYDLTASPMGTRTVVHTFSTSGKVACCAFNGRVVVVHPVDGVFYSDASAGSLTVAAAGVTGKAIAVWQNKVWVTGNGYRVWWSAAGDYTSWTTATDYVDVRDVDDNPCTAIGNGNGMDVIGRAGLLVSKETSLYRIYDSTTGAYTTVDTSRGAAWPEGVATTTEGVYLAAKHGVYRVRGDRIEMISQPIQNLWDSGVYYTGGAGVIEPVAWTSEGRVYFSNPYAMNEILFEWVPDAEAWFLHSTKDSSSTLARVYSATSLGYDTTSGQSVACGYMMAVSSTNTNVLRMWAPAEGFASPRVRVLDQWNPSVAADVNVSAFLFSQWFGGGLDDVRCERVVLHGWAGSDSATDNVTVKVYKDWDQTTAWQTRASATFANATGTATPAELGRYVVGDIGVAKAFMLGLSHTSSSTATRAPDYTPISSSLDSLIAPAFALTALQADLIGLRA